MPSKYTPAQKENALEMLEIGKDIGFVHFRTGIPERTLRDWRKQLEDQSNRQTAEKGFPSAADWPTESESCLDDESAKEPQPSPDNPQDETPANTDIEDFTYIREHLMQHARHMAANLQPDEPDSNRRTLALARILDRIQWLDTILPDRFPEKVIRFEYAYDGSVHDTPPWAGASEGFDRSLKGFRRLGSARHRQPIL